MSHLFSAKYFKHPTIDLTWFLKKDFDLNSISIFLFIFLNYGEVKSKGDLTRQKPISAEILMRGTIGESHFYEPSILRFETGKLYKLTIKNISDSIFE